MNLSAAHLFLLQDELCMMSLQTIKRAGHELNVKEVTILS